jgi:hypothetical protein
MNPLDRLRTLYEARHGRLVNERQGDGAPFSLKETATQRT